MARTNLNIGNFPNILQTPLTTIISQITEHDQALDSLGAPVGVSGATSYETITSGALTPSAKVSILSINGTQAFTLANGTVAGQTKRIMCGVATNTPAGTLTITTPDATAGFVCAGAFFFDTVGQGITLLWTGTAWRATEVLRAGKVAVTIGTTVLTNFNLYAAYVLTMTGTNASTGTKAMPNGSAVGEVCSFLVASAGGTTGATLAIAAAKPDGTTGTTLTMSSATATADTSSWRWDGTIWYPIVVAASAVVS